MLEIIKSSFFKIFLFDYINEGTKLKLIKYNKNMQKELNINLINYMRFSERYIIYETKESGREYNSYNDELIYAGCFLNGERNGKGFEFTKQGRTLAFEGEYLNGKRNGKGKEYLNGNLIFEGEYLNGKKWNGKAYDEEKNMIYEITNGKGFIKEYFCKGKLKFEGDYLNGQLNGKIKKYYYDGTLKFEGEYLNGKLNGKIKRYYLNGNLKFEGDYLNGKKWNGKRYDEKNNIIYEIKNGKGYIKKRVSFKNGYYIFEGEYINGVTKGIKKEFYYDNFSFKLDWLIFKGECINGEKNGKGREYDNFGNLLFEVEYLNNHKYKGKIIYQENWSMKANIYLIKNGMEKDII